MIIAILILFLVIIILSIRINLHIVSVNDTYKIYMNISKVSILIPHQKIFAKVIDKEKKKKFKDKKEDLFKALESKKLIYNIFSHSVLERIYVKRLIDKKKNEMPLNVASYYILSSQILSFVKRRFKLVNNDSILLDDTKNYENVDYYLHAKTDVISIIWAFVVTIFRRKKYATSH